MAQSENKTQPTPVPVAEFLSGQTEARQAECAALKAKGKKVSVRRHATAAGHAALFLE